MLLTDREWREFYLISDETFILNKTDTIKSTNINSLSKKYDVVGATSKNNGNVNFVSEQYIDKLVSGNCICLIKTGQGSVGDAVYKYNSFIPSNNVCVIRKKKLNRYIGLFIVAEINKQSNRYSYGYIRNERRIKKEKIMLPYNNLGEPDYKFMESYIKEQETIKKQEYFNCIKNTSDKLKYKKIPTLEKKEWGKICISDLFFVNIGKAIDGNKVNKNDGYIPYITRKEVTNGLDGFILYDNTYMTYNYPVITIGNETAQPFVQNYKFFTGTKVNVLSPKKTINMFALHFISISLKQQKCKYSYSYTINSTRLKQQGIMLPINENNEPDYEYMEQYVKNMMITKYNQYIQYTANASETH